MKWFGMALLALIAILTCALVLVLLYDPLEGYQDPSEGPIPDRLGTTSQDEWPAWVEENPGTYSEWYAALYSACVDSTMEATDASMPTVVPPCMCSAKALLDEFGVRGVERLVTGQGTPREEDLARDLHQQCLLDPLR